MLSKRTYIFALALMSVVSVNSSASSVTSKCLEEHGEPVFCTGDRVKKNYSTRRGTVTAIAAETSKVVVLLDDNQEKPVEFAPEQLVKKLKCAPSNPSLCLDTRVLVARKKDSSPPGAIDEVYADDTIFVKHDLPLDQTVYWYAKNLVYAVKDNCDTACFQVGEVVKIKGTANEAKILEIFQNRWTSVEYKRPSAPVDAVGKIELKDLEKKTN